MASVPSLPTECRLCPRECRADRRNGARGVCGADSTLRIARAALHLWEEPPICTDAGSGAIFFSGCPLRCCYCQNAQISMGGRGKAVDLERLAQIMLELQDQGACNINLVTPSHYVPWIVAGLARARALGLELPVLYNCSGYESPQTILELAGDVDIYLSDFKYAPDAVSDAARRYSSAPDYFDWAWPALAEMIKQVGPPVFEKAADGSSKLARGVILRHLLLPGRLEDSKWLVGRLWDAFGDQLLYSFMSQYTPLVRFESYPELNNRTDPADYEALLCYADAIGIEDYYWQEGDAALESFVPAWDGSGV